jgi:diacylglycerol kinase family enzyme
VGLGWVNGRYFAFHVGMGYDAAVVAQVERRSGLKRYAGHPLFVYAAFATWFRHYDRRRARFTVHLPDGTSIDEGRFALCLNSNPYTFFGNRPLDVAPEASLDRGLVAITIRSMRFTRVLRLASAALTSSKRLRELSYVEVRTDLSGMVVEGHGPFPYQVDGDFLGETEHLEFRHEPEALALVLPTSFSFPER